MTSDAVTILANRQVVGHLQEFMQALPAGARPLHEVALKLFLQREANYLVMLAHDRHLAEERFLNFLECPSTYDMVMEALQEDAPVNAVGTGNIAGCGVGPKGEPGFRPRKKRIDEEVKPSETFAGADVFEVDTPRVMASRFGKNRYHRYSRYVGEDEIGEAIRQHGRKTKRDIVLKDQTGAMVFLRRKGLPQM